MHAVRRYQSVDLPENRLVKEFLTQLAELLELRREHLGQEDELLGAMKDLRNQDVNILTLGQYLRPSMDHLPVARFYTPEEFAELKGFGISL